MQDPYTMCVRSEFVVGQRLLPGCYVTKQDFPAVELTAEKEQLQNDWQNGGRFTAGLHTPFPHMSDWTSPNTWVLRHWMRNWPVSCRVTHTRTHSTWWMKPLRVLHFPILLPICSGLDQTLHPISGRKFSFWHSHKEKARLHTQQGSS